MIKELIYKFKFVILPIFSISILSGCVAGGVPMLPLGTILALAQIKVMYSCIAEGVKVDTPNGRKPIEKIKPGDYVIGYSGKKTKVIQAHSYFEDSNKAKFYRVTFSNGAILELCSMHRIEGVRVKNLSKRNKILKKYKIKSITEYKGVERSYDLLTKDKGYRIGGIPVNSMIEEMYKSGHTKHIKH